MKSISVPALAWMMCIVVTGVCSMSSADEPCRWTVPDVLRRVPPLSNNYTGRLPMITWPAFVMSTNDTSFREKKPLPAEIYRELARRGLTQRIPLNESYLEMAKAIQAAGAAVVFVEGWGGNGPYELGHDPLHKLPPGFQIAKGDRHYPCPLLFAGWQAKADEVRNTLRKYRDAGIYVSAAWLDWEVEPLVWSKGRWEQARACSRCVTLFPPPVLESWDEYVKFIMSLRSDLFSAYLAAPILEIYPACSVTDWEKVYSTPERPTPSCWGTWKFPPMSLGLFTAANPVAYGNDIYYQEHWSTNWNYPLDQKHMDRLYTSIMLGQVSAHAENSIKLNPHKQCVPWVCRYCPDVDDEKVPILSRTRYREILRHIWLRGADSMQIFNEPRPRHPEIAVEEVEDAVSVYDEMLQYRQFLEEGRIMCTDVPEVTWDGPIWSGLCLQNEAIVRAFTQGKNETAFTIQPWKDAKEIQLTAPPEGQTWLLRKDETEVTAEPANKQR